MKLQYTMQYPVIPIELFYNHCIWNVFSCINVLASSCKTLATLVAKFKTELLSKYTKHIQNFRKNGNKIEYNELPNGWRHGMYIVYDKFDILMETCAYVNGLFEGKYEIMIDTENNHKVVCNYVKGMRQGACAETKNGEVIESGSYLNDRLHGEYICYGDNGGVLSKRNYINGEYDGVMVTYFDDRRINSLTQYEAGYKNGKCYEKNPAGEYCRYLVYKNDIIVDYKNCNFDGQCLMYTPMGDNLLVTIYHANMRHAAEWTIDKYGLKHGPYREWTDMGILIEECNYYRDDLDGKYKIWNFNGGLIYEANYNRGDKIDNVVEYYTNGDVRSITPYVDGKRNGTRVNYDQQHRLRQIKSYHRDYKSGLHIKYRANGTKVFEKNYYHNRLHGAYIRYNNQGIIVNKTDYYMGVKVRNPNQQ